MAGFGVLFHPMVSPSILTFSGHQHQGHQPERIPTSSTWRGLTFTAQSSQKVDNSSDD
jgi:hypothetical protein